MKRITLTISLLVICFLSLSVSAGTKYWTKDYKIESIQLIPNIDGEEVCAVRCQVPYVWNDPNDPFSEKDWIVFEDNESIKYNQILSLIKYVLENNLTVRFRYETTCNLGTNNENEVLKGIGIMVSPVQ